MSEFESQLSKELQSTDRPNELRKIPNPRKRGKFMEVRVWVLSDEEIARAQADAAMYLENDLKLSALQLALSQESQLYQAEEQRQLLVRAFRSRDNPDDPFSTIDELRAFLDPDTRQIWMRTLAEYTRKRSPISEEKDQNKILGIIRNTKEVGALSDYLLSLDFDTLVDIVISLEEASWKQTSPNS